MRRLPVFVRSWRNTRTEVSREQEATWWAGVSLVYSVATMYTGKIYCRNGTPNTFQTVSLGTRVNKNLPKGDVVSLHALFGPDAWGHTPLRLRGGEAYAPAGLP